MNKHKIECQYFSQEDLLQAGCLDMKMAIKVAELSLIEHKNNEVLFPHKIVQIFNQHTQERINCLPATFFREKICGVKWVSVFPPNPVRHGLQNLSAVIILSEIEKGFPIAYMEGTLCSNMRVGAMGALGAKYLANPHSGSIGFIGAGEQSKMHLLAMKTQIPSIKECRVAAKTHPEEIQFIKQMSTILPDMKFVDANTDLQKAVDGADIIVTATSAQAPLLKAKWMKEGAFYSHVGGFEDEYAVAENCDKIVCDDWDTVKHRTQTLSRMYKEKILKDEDIHANLVDLVSKDKKGRESKTEKNYFNAVGLAFVDVAIAIAMYKKALKAKVGQPLTVQECMIFDHPEIKDCVQSLA